MRLIILGATGAGKGTQSRFISRILKLKHIEMGKLLRKEARKNKLIKKFMTQGKLIPNNITIKILNKEIKNRKDFVLDGFPRTLVQAKALRFKPDLVLFLNVGKDDIVKRLLLRKRFDDTKKNIEERYHLYLKKTLPVINYYKKKNILVTVNGNPSIKEVSKNIKEALMKFSKFDN